MTADRVPLAHRAEAIDLLHTWLYSPGGAGIRDQSVLVAVATLVLDQANASMVAKSDIGVPSACLVVRPEAASPLNVRPGEPSDRSLRDDLANLLADWVTRVDDYDQGADAILALVAQAIERRADVESEFRDGTNYAHGWRDAADLIKDQIVARSAASNQPGSVA